MWHTNYVHVYQWHLINAHCTDYLAWCTTCILSENDFGAEMIIIWGLLDHGISSVILSLLYIHPNNPPHNIYYLLPSSAYTWILIRVLMCMYLFTLSINGSIDEWQYCDLLLPVSLSVIEWICFLLLIRLLTWLFSNLLNATAATFSLPNVHSPDQIGL